MPFIGNAGQFSNIYEKNYETTTLRVVEGDAAYQAYNPADSHYKLITTLQEITDIGNVTSSTVQFSNAITGFTTTSNVGIANSTPTHTLDVGSKAYIDENASNTFWTSGTLYADKVLSETTEITNSVTTRDVLADKFFPKTNGFIEVTSNVGVLNTAPVHTLDIGANVQIDEYGSNTFWTSGNVYSEHYKSSNVTVSGSVDTDQLIVNDINSKDTDFVNFTSNVGVLNTAPVHKLDIGANVQIDEYGSNKFWTSGNVHANLYTGSEIQLSGVIRATDFILTGGSQATPTPDLQTISEVLASGGSVPFSSDRTLTLSNVTTALDATIVRSITTHSNIVADNVTVTNDLTIGTNKLFVDVSESKVGINNASPSKDLDVTGEIASSSNLTIGTNKLFVDVSGGKVGINKSVPTKDLDVTGEIASSGDLTIGTNKLFVDVSESRVGINKSTPTKTLDVTGEIASSSNLTIGTNKLFVDVSTGKVGINNASPSKDLDVTGELACSSHLTVGGNLTVNGTTTTVNTTSLRVEDTLIELGKNNTAGTSDLGLILKRPTGVGLKSNVAIVYSESIDTLKFGHTLSGSDATPVVFDTSNALAMSLNGSFVATGTVRGSSSLSPGSYLTGFAYNGGANQTFNVDATTTNTVNKVVARDGSGNFSAGTITATFIGNGSGLSALNASNVSSGTLNNARLPSTINVTNLVGNGSGLSALNASNVSSGTLDTDRIPSLNASKITAGTLDAARIPSLDASKITAGTLSRPISTTTGTFSGEVITGNTLKVGTNTNNETAKTIYFGGTYGDNSYDHCVIEKRVWQASSEKQELLLFSGSDGETTAGPDRIRLKGGQILFDTLNNSTDRTTENTKMIIKANGNVGIGMTSPGYKLDVNGVARLNNVAFAAYRSEINTPNRSYTGTVVFNNEYFDQSGNYDTGTGLFTAPVAGIYHFSFNAYTNQAGNTLSRLRLYKNNFPYTDKGARIEQHGNCIDVTIKLAANDTVSLRGHSSYPVYMYASSGNNIFCGHLLTAV